MILVTVGTNGPPFDRLLQEIEGLGRDEEIVVQHGPSRVRPAGASCVDYLSFEELSRYVQAARVVVTHAGAGCVLLALAHGHRPLMVPRRQSFNEAVDDHQVVFGRRLDREGIAACVDDPRNLCEAIRNASEIERTHHPKVSPTGALAQEIGQYLRSVCNAA